MNSLPRINSHLVARQPDHSLDIRLVRVQREPEHDNVALSNLLEAIDELVDEDPLLVMQPRHHACSLDLDRLIQEDDDNDRDRNRDDDVSSPDLDIEPERARRVRGFPRVRGIFLTRGLRGNPVVVQMHLSDWERAVRQAPSYSITNTPMATTLCACPACISGHVGRSAGEKKAVIRVS